MILADDHVTFWNLFFLLLIFIPALLVWAFAVFDIFRRVDISGGMKALWLAVVIFLPFLGTIVYLIVRPVGASGDDRVGPQPPSAETVAALPAGHVRTRGGATGALRPPRPRQAQRRGVRRREVAPHEPLTAPAVRVRRTGGGRDRRRRGGERRRCLR